MCEIKYLHDKIEAPEHLSNDARAFYEKTAQEFGITDCAGLKVLLAAAQAWDRAETARKIIEIEGMTIADRFGQSKNHPLLPIERDSRSAFLTATKALNLDLGGD